MSMLFHHYKQLGEGIEQVEQIGAKVIDVVIKGQAQFK
jgi:hypothetical protein